MADDNQEQHGLATNDPYQNMERSDIKPDFSANSDSLRDSERRATPHTSDTDSPTPNSDPSSDTTANSKGSDSLHNPRQAEQHPTGFFPSAPPLSTRAKIKFLRRQGPMAVIVLLILAFSGLMLSSESLLPFSLLEQYREAFDTISTSNKLRTASLLGYQLSGSPIKYAWSFGFGTGNYRLSPKQLAQFKERGIYLAEFSVYFPEEEMTRRTNLLVFDDGSGYLRLMGSADGANLVRENPQLSNLRFLDGFDPADKKFDLKRTNTIEYYFNRNFDFRDRFSRATRNWRTSLGAWFDYSTFRKLKDYKVSRNLFRDFQGKVKEEPNQNRRSATIRLMSSEDEAFSFRIQSHEGKQVKGEDGKLRNELNTLTTEETIASRNAKKSEAHKILETTAKTHTDGGNKLFSTAVNGACVALNVIGNIEQLISAQEALQIIKLVSSFFEATDKVRYGHSADAPAHEFSNALTTPADTLYEEAIDPDNEKDLNTETKIARRNMTAMQSAGIASTYSHTVPNLNDVSVQNFTLGHRFQGILNRLALSAEAFANCALSRMASAILSIAIDLISMASCIATVGGGCLVAQGMKSVLSGIAGGVAISFAADWAIKMITPWAVSAFTRDLISELAGEDLGNAMTIGANMYMGDIHRAHGGAPTNRKNYLQFAHKQQELQRAEADYQRSLLSPFDPSSQHTFLGSLIKQVITLNTFSSAPTNLFSSLSTVTSKSLISLLPSATAYKISQTLPDEKTFAKHCPTLASIGAVGDLGCHHYTVSDIYGMSIHPEEYMKYLTDDETEHYYIDENGIIPNSKLANYLRFCANRTSPFGTPDQNIAGRFGSIFNRNNNNDNPIADIAETVIDQTPIIGDLVDVYTSNKQLSSAGWITGESCVIGNTVDIHTFEKSIRWSEGRLFQRFVEDQAMLESMDDEYVSLVTKFYQEEEGNHPTDFSYEGTLSRYSGLKKETVVALLDYFNYQSYIAQYNPSTRVFFSSSSVISKPIYIEASSSLALSLPLFSSYLSRLQFSITA